MAETIEKIAVDTNKVNVMEDLVAKQGDNGSRFLQIKLQTDGGTVGISKNATILFNALKPDGKKAQSIGSVVDGSTVKVELTGQMLAVNGRLQCDVSILDGGKKLTTTSFFVMVQEASIKDVDIVSSDDYELLSGLILQVQGFEETEQQRQTNETARQSAEVLRQQANTEVKTLIDSFVGDMVIASTTTPGAVKSGGDITVAKDGTVSITEALKRIYPVGKIEITYGNTNPSTYLGFGTWEQFAKGQTLIGVNTADADFNAAGKTGGEKSHKLTVSELPIHRSRFQAGRKVSDETGFTNQYVVGAKSVDYNVNVDCEPIGGDQPHNNLPPYITVYFWRRTA